MHRKLTSLTLGPLAGSILASVCLAADPHDHDASDPHAHHKAMLSKPTTGQSVDVDLVDMELLNQDGASVQFPSEVIGDKIVIMDFVYTTCTTICPVLTAVFTQLQDRLGERLGRDVLLVSVSVDPTTDTPRRLKAYAKRIKARDGWTWLTGRKRAVDHVLEGLGAYTPDFTQHPSMILVGDGRSGQWARFYGFPSPDQILAQVDGLLAARHAATDG